MSDAELPKRDALARCAADLGRPTEDLDTWLGHAERLLEDIDRLGSGEAGDTRAVRRDLGRSPTASEDPFDAIARFCEVTGAEGGSLAGIRVGVKDNIAVAGVPMFFGGDPERALTPSEDAAVVERLLDAGATVTAKTTIGTVTSSARNPHDPRYSAGFSSSGSATAVVTGLVDAALGTDHSGSVRIPAAWCGTVGMKATHGLVPSSYGLGHHNLNEIGPITRTVAENAALLEVMAPDANARGHADADVGGLRIGVIVESASPAAGSHGALGAFQSAQERLTGLGATLVPISIPQWCDAASVLLAFTGLEAVATHGHWLEEDFGYEERIDGRLFADLAAQRRTLPERAVASLVGEYLRRHGDGASDYIRAHNFRADLRRDIDRWLHEVDLLITPTTRIGAFELTDDTGGDDNEASRLLHEVIRNTAPASLTGHPALSVPSAPDEHDLPTGLQIVGRRYDERTIYRAALAFEGAHARADLKRSAEAR